MIKKITAVALLSLLTVQTLLAQVKPALIPQPVEETTGKGFFTLSKDVIIVADPSLNTEANFLKDFLNQITAYRIPVKIAATGKVIRLSLLKAVDKTINDEGYKLNVTPATVTIQANTAAGIFYGIQSLIQLLPPEVEAHKAGKQLYQLPAIAITDYPRFEWRGLMLDVSRHFFPLSFVKKYIDQMAKYKYNVFHWHLTDDPGWRVAIKSYPRLIEVGAWRPLRVGRWGSFPAPPKDEKDSDGGFYSAEEIKEAIQYAKDRHITIVPEVDMPGHSAAIIASYPELSCTGQPRPTYSGSSDGAGVNVLCAGKERTFEVLDTLIGDLAAMFPGEYIHIGGDEVDKSFWKHCALCQKRMKDEGLKNEEELQSYFIKRVTKLVNKHGKKVIGWDEILEGGLAPGAAVMSWRGYEGAIEAAKAGHKAVMTPTSFCYLDYMQTDMHIENTGGAYVTLSRVYEYEPVPAEVNEKYILGGQGNLWTEFISSAGRAEYMTWPRAFALSEIYWSPKKVRSTPEFLSRVERHFVRLYNADVNYAPAIYDPQIHVKKDAAGKPSISFTTEVKNVEIYYTFDGVIPDQYAIRYLGGPVMLPPGASDVKAVTYRDGKQMGRVLSIPLNEIQGK